MDSATAFAPPPPSSETPMASDSEVRSLERPPPPEKQPPRQEDDISDLADSDSDIPPPPNLPAPGLPRISPHLRLSEREIRAQQQNLARQYTQLAQIFTAALERRVRQTLQQLETAETSDFRDESRKDKRRTKRSAKDGADFGRAPASGPSFTAPHDPLVSASAMPGLALEQNKYADNVAIGRLGKLLVYQINSIRQASRCEALSIWRDFTRQRMDLRELMCHKMSEKIMRLEGDRREPVRAGRTDMSLPDWISANLDTVHLLRSQPHVSGLSNAEALSDIQQMRANSAPPTALSPPLPLSDSDSEDDVVKLKSKQDTEEVAETMVLCASQMPPHPSAASLPASVSVHASPPLARRTYDSKHAADSFALTKRRKTTRNASTATKQAVEVIPSHPKLAADTGAVPRPPSPNAVPRTPQLLRPTPPANAFISQGVSTMGGSGNNPHVSAPHGTTLHQVISATPPRNAEPSLVRGSVAPSPAGLRSVMVAPNTHLSGQLSGQPNTQPNTQLNPQLNPQPTGQATGQLSGQPAGQPTTQLSGQLNPQPTTQPTGHPSRQPKPPVAQRTAQPTPGSPSAPPAYPVPPYAYYPYQMVPPYAAQRYAPPYANQFPAQAFSPHYAPPYNQPPSYPPFPSQYAAYQVNAVPAPPQPSPQPANAPPSHPVPTNAPANGYVYGYPEQWPVSQISVPPWPYPWPPP